MTYDLIDLNNYANSDSEQKEIIDTYNEDANLDGVIGYTNAYHSKSKVGSFYTDALRSELNVDFTIQNTGGVRSYSKRRGYLNT
jgi:hypothetical protein